MIIISKFLYAMLKKPCLLANNSSLKSRISKRFNNYMWVILSLGFFTIGYIMCVRVPKGLSQSRISNSERIALRRQVGIK